MFIRQLRSVFFSGILLIDEIDYLDYILPQVPTIGIIPEEPIYELMPEVTILLLDLSIIPDIPIISSVNEIFIWIS